MCSGKFTWSLAHEFLARNWLMCKHEERITSWLTDPQKAYIHWVKLCKYNLSELFVTRVWFSIPNWYEFCLLRVVYLIHSIQYCTSTYFVSLTASLSNDHLAVGCNDVLCSLGSLSNGSKIIQIWPKDLEQPYTKWIQIVSGIERSITEWCKNQPMFTGSTFESGRHCTKLRAESSFPKP